jgi:tetrahydromethanopterin S-methyltransferase subunit A
LPIKSRIEEAAGFACKFLYPVSTSTFNGNGDSIAICTLSSIDLLKKISKNNIMEKVVIAGRLFSENKGIDSLVSFCATSLSLKYLLICGRDTKGHYPGDALIKLMVHGIDAKGRIVNAISHHPYLTVHTGLIDEFRSRIELIDMRNCYDLDEIRHKIDSIT